jgi:hypothetical protein
MREPEGFLKRWSRRKRDAAAARADEEAPSPPPPTEGEAASGEPASAIASDPPTVDLTKLPSIESIAADTDIRGFLAPGVPPELTRAALRRAWRTDPAIRDFVGIAENQWDFAAAHDIPGFGALARDEAERLAAALLGDERDEATPARTPQAPQIADGSEPVGEPEAMPHEPVEKLPASPAEREG